jgi:hypothetical protein
VSSDPLDDVRVQGIGREGESSSYGQSGVRQNMDGTFF